MVLNYLDDYQKNYSRRDHVMQALIASGRWEPKILFPEFFGGKQDGEATTEEEQEEAFEDKESSIDYSKVEWKSPTQGEDAKAEFERLMAALNDNKNGSLSGDDITGDWV